MTDKETKWPRQRLYYLLGAIILFLIGVKLYYSAQRNEDIVTNDFLEIVDSLVLAEKPQGKRSGRGSTPTYIEFKCIGFTKTFMIDVYHFPCSNQKAIYDLKPGDTISIKLLKSDIPEIDLETLNSSSNQIHSLVYKSQNYLDLDCRNKESEKDNKSAFWTCFIMAPLTLLIALFKKKPRILGSIEPIFILVVVGLIIMFILNYDVFI